MGAVQSSDTVEGLGQLLGMPEAALAETVQGLSLGETDGFGRTFGDTPLRAPFHGVRVTGALFHTQGGLRVNAGAQVLRKDGTTFDTLYAGGGAACGVSGSSDSGYLSGNGLLSAVVLGRKAGKGA